MAAESDSIVRGKVGTIAVLAVGWLLVASMAGARFVFETLTIGHFEPSAVAACAAVAISIGLLAVGGMPNSSDVRDIGAPRAILAIAAGVFGFVGAPLLVLLNRYSDAPSGSVVLFWTTAFAGFALVSSAYFVRTAAPHVRMAGGLISLAGAAGVLANWERPSSFSLFVRFGQEQLAMAAAAVVWAASITALVLLARRCGVRGTFGLAALGSLVSAVAMALTALPETRAAVVTPSVLAYSAACALAAVATLTLAYRTEPHVAASAFLAAPVAVTGLTYIEAAVGALGPRPVLLGPIAWAAAVVAAGTYIIARSVESPTRRVGSREGVRRLGLGLALLAAIAATVALFGEGVAVSVRGVRTDMAEFAARFSMDGWETVGGWLAISAALLGVAEWVRGARVRILHAAGTAVAVAVTCSAWVALRYVPLHTWVPWIPVEVQQDYGTEYASITFSAVSTPMQVVAVVAVLASTAVLLVYSLGTRGDTDSYVPVAESRNE